MAAKKKTASVLVTPAFKTVAIFSGIIGQRIELKNSATPYCRGRIVAVPFTDPSFYLLVERQLAHILFSSDARARDIFVRTFVGQLKTLAANNGKKLSDSDVERIEATISGIVDILESRRIESLWSGIYPGSHAQFRERLQSQATVLAPRAHDSFFDLFSCLDSGMKVDPGRLDPYRPIFETALKKVENKGFEATLALTRWVVGRLVDTLLEEQNPEPSDEPGGAARHSAHDRLAAMEALPDLFGRMDVNFEAHYSDYHGCRDPVATSRARAGEALRLDMRKEGALEGLLATSAEDARAQMDSIQKQLEKRISKDAWLSKDAFCKLDFVDIEPEETQFDPVTEPTTADIEAIHRLRGLFGRVMGRRARRLDETGSEIDVPSAIERFVTGTPLPIFRTAANAKGFRALLLIDRSHSMSPPEMEPPTRIQHAERAARVIMRALDFPFVELTIWGFQMLDDGEVTITRFSPFVDSFKADAALVKGGTPLHIALRVATRELQTTDDVRQMFVITDGAPMYATEDKKLVPDKVLHMFVRDQINTARRSGINVTTFIIGDKNEKTGQVEFDVSREELRYMFGPERHWKVVDTSTLGDDLVRAVSSSFIHYLNAS
jgi:hypothetical protein